MITKYIVRGYMAFSEIDNFEEGCIGQCKNEFLSAHEWHCEADTLDELIDSLKAEFKCDDVMLNSCDEDGRLDLQGMQLKAFHPGRPSESTITKWKAGELGLWLTCYTFHVEIVQIEMDLLQHTSKDYNV